MTAQPGFDPACPDSAFPVQIGDKWSAMIVLSLEAGPLRFTDLKSRLPGVSAKILTETLRSMVRDGMVHRQPYDENPPRVTYELTDLGRSVLELIDAVRRWAAGNLGELEHSRRRFDAHLT